MQNEKKKTIEYLAKFFIIQFNANVRLNFTKIPEKRENFNLHNCVKPENRLMVRQVLKTSMLHNCELSANMAHLVIIENKILLAFLDKL